LSDVTRETIEDETVESVTSVLEIVRKWKITGKERKCGSFDLPELALFVLL